MKITEFYTLGIFGAFGAGKSLFLLEKGIELACLDHLSIAASFRLNKAEIRKLADLYPSKYSWLRCCRFKDCLTIDDLLCVRNSVILLDEAGVEIFSRSWKSRGKAELEGLFKLRQYNNVLIYTAQDWKQVDAQFRERTEICLWVLGFQNRRKKKLISRLILQFDQSKFELFLSKIENKTKIIYPVVLAGFRFRFEFMNKKLKEFFNCYSSFNDLELNRRLGMMRYIDSSPLDRKKEGLNHVR